MPVILEARDLVKRYPLRAGSVDVLHGVSLSVEQGEFVAIMGALELPYPKRMPFAVPGNRACGECPPGVPEDLRSPCELSLQG